MDKTGRLNFIKLGIDDMTNLVELSDDSLLYNLQTRYSQKIIYTYIGSILISINPYSELGIYDKKHIFRYQNKSLQEVPPHLFGIAEINYSKMMMENENQVIVISGESGAGKTESFKRLLRYLAYTSGGVKELSSSDRELSNDIANKILDSTPLLESFGNAKTIRNDNSSRFGKYVEIFFENGTICGSRTTNYLLEKSRIVNINTDERGYHIFYELLQGLDSYGKSQYYLKNVQDYAYLNNAKDFTVKGRDDAANLKEFMSQWSTLGLTNEDLDVAMRIISAVLHLGNIQFREEEDASYMSETENVNIVAKMLKVDANSLISCLTMKTTDTVKDIASSPVNAEQAANLRDTLAKHLYSELFDWIVAKVNASLNEKTVTIKRSPSHLDRSMNSSTSKLRCIAMLDIYGFENFPENSLEQLCINYANETLQQFFNRYVFELEQAEYKQEGISWHYVIYPDNQPIIDLLSAKPSGIIQILNDECSIPQGSDDAFLSKCHNVHQKNANFEKPKKMHPPQFIIRHFAGNIYYNVNGFLDKNRDLIRKEAILLIEHCGVEELSLMFKKKKERTLKNPNIKARTPAVMADFQNSLATLLNKMKTCQPWFIRCLKPNNKKLPLTFDKEIVMDQMRYTGILETVKIRKSGFPIRILFSVFLSRFYLLQSKDMRRYGKKEPQEACLKMMPKFGGQRGKEFEVGKTKLFLKEHFARHLESQVRIIRERSAIKIQRRWRAYWKIREIIIKNKAATKIQAVVRGFIVRRRIKRLHMGIIKLQAFVRMQLVRRKFIEEHPEFLKYAVYTPETSLLSQSTATAYKFPDVNAKHKSKKTKNKKPSMKFNYNLLKIPIKLAFLLEKSTEHYGRDHEIPSSESIMQTCRVQHLYNRDEYQLPNDINEYHIEEFIEDFGNNVPLESKSRPIQIPFLRDNLSPLVKDDCLNAHKLLLRLIYVDSMPWFHRYLAGSFLSYMASTSPQLQMEILLQIIAETIPAKFDGGKISGKQHFTNDSESKRISRAWTLLGNVLSHIIPVPQIFNYVLKYVSSTVGVDQACTCQEKLLQFVNDNVPKIPKLFPASNLEWRANSRGTKTSLKAVHADDVQNSVHVNSFTTAENFANHSLCFRHKRFRVNKGWSISIVVGDSVIDCSGHNYVLDVVSALELTSHWADLVGYGMEHKFLMSKKIYDFNTANSDNLPPHLKQKAKYPDGSVNKSNGTISSRKSMDSWVDKYFDKSFRNEEPSSTRVHDFIHGLEDDVKAQSDTSQLPGSRPAMNPGMMGPTPIGMSGLLTPHSGYYVGPQHFADPMQQNYYYSPNSNRQYLEEQLNSVELQNKFIQTSIENEILQKRLMDIRQQGAIQLPMQMPNPHFSYQVQPAPYNPMMYPMHGNPYMAHQPYLTPSHIQGQPFQQRFESSDARSSTSHSNQVSNTPEISSMDTLDHNHKSTKSVQTKETVAPPPPPPSDPPHATVTFNGVIRRHSTNQSDGSTHRESDSRIVPKKRKSIVKYSEVSPASNVVVDDVSVLPQLQKQEIMSKSQLRAAEIPKVNVANRAAFLDKFFLDKNYQTPQTTKITKRPAPLQPIETDAPSLRSPEPIPRSYTGHVPAPPPLIPQPKLIPRPSIHARASRLQSQNDDPTIDDITKENDFKETFEKLDRSFNSNDISSSVRIPVVRKRRRTISFSKTAVILSGLPDIRYYTYTNLPWFPLVKIELFLPGEIQESTVLNPVIFCQIVRDLIEFPCARWVGSERRELLAMIGPIKDSKNVRSWLSTPSNTILKVINRVQNCELYFSRFYSIQWLSSNAPGQISHWLAISHSGIRFVEQNLKKPESVLKIVEHIPYKNLKSISCEEHDIYGNPQKLVITTRSNKNYEMWSSHALSSMNLVHEFVGDQESINKNDSSSFLSNSGISPQLFKHKKTKRPPIDVVDSAISPRSSSDMMTLGVNKQRIPVKNVFDNSENLDKNASLSVTMDLVDFMMSSSKYKNRDDVKNVVLKWHLESISEPFLPSLNNNLMHKAIEMYQLILDLSGEFAIEKKSTASDIGMEVFKIINRNRELIEEVIIQIMKQINGNPVSNNRFILWNLLSTLIIFFGVSKRMEPYFYHHLKQMLKNKSNLDQDSTLFTTKVLQKTMTIGPRKELPLENELKHLLNGVREAKMTIYVPRESVECDIRFNNTVGEIVKNICRTFDVSVEHETAEYSLALVEVNESNVPIKSAECLKIESYLFDSINCLARNKKYNFIFYFSRSSWIVPIMPFQKSQRIVNLTFNQLSKDVVSENWMSSERNDSRILKGITAIAYFNLKGQGYDKSISVDVLGSILPKWLLEENDKYPSKQALISMIYSVPETINTSHLKDRTDYQRKFIELVCQLPRFGWIRFPILRLNHIPSANNLTINFTPQNISICNDTNNELILKISLSSFTSFQATKIDATLAQFVLRYNGIQETQFIAANLSELVFLLNQYHNIRSLLPNRRLYDA